MIPHPTQDILGPELVRACIQHNAHDDYLIEGMVLNDLTALAERLIRPGKLLTTDEHAQWAFQIQRLIESARLHQQL